ncbi:hypothetical protein PHSC3_002060 [Chlamydiales bacterium STE3]|nr:hypothetical protein PHSC3_002060 [Chlamydiales bacterium STE3]
MNFDPYTYKLNGSERLYSKNGELYLEFPQKCGFKKLLHRIFYRKRYDSHLVISLLLKMNRDQSFYKSETQQTCFFNNYRVIQQASRNRVCAYQNLSQINKIFRAIFFGKPKELSEEMLFQEVISPLEKNANLTHFAASLQFIEKVYSEHCPFEVQTQLPQAAEKIIDQLQSNIVELVADRSIYHKENSIKELDSIQNFYHRAESLGLSGETLILKISLLNQTIDELKANLLDNAFTKLCSNSALAFENKIEEAVVREWQKTHDYILQKCENVKELAEHIAFDSKANITAILFFADFFAHPSDFIGKLNRHLDFDQLVRLREEQKEDFNLLKAILEKTGLWLIKDYIDKEISHPKDFENYLQKNALALRRSILPLLG